MRKICFVMMAALGLLMSMSSYARDYDEHSQCYKDLNKARNSCRKVCWDAHKNSSNKNWSTLNNCQNKCDPPFNKGVKKCPSRKRYH